MEFFHYDNHLGAYAPLILSLIFWMIAFDRLDRKKVEHRLFVISIISFLTLHYLIWRIAYTVVPVSLGSFQGIWIWVCFAAELLALLEYAVFYLNMSGLTDRHKEADIHEQHLRSRKKKDLPNVDVFITTYNEGIEVVERTILGALHLDWPKDKLKVYVLDDGHRDWLRDYTLSKGALYISRENNEHFKAGNINNALKKTDGDFIVVLDADFVPFRQFIYRTLGFMEDKNVGIVQTPQCFFNHDYIQSNLHLHTEASDDQRIFFDHMMESRDGWDAAFWCGSAV